MIVIGKNISASLTRKNKVSITEILCGEPQKKLLSIHMQSLEKSTVRALDRIFLFLRWKFNVKN
jgi:hypothetical protein